MEVLTSRTMTISILSRALLRKGQPSCRSLAGVANSDVKRSKTKFSKTSASKHGKTYRNLELASDHDELLRTPPSRIESGLAGGGEGPQRDKSRRGPFPRLQNGENQPAGVLPEDSEQSTGENPLKSDTLPIQRRLRTDRPRDDAENYPARPDAALSSRGRHPSDDEGLHIAKLCAKSHDMARLNKLLVTRRHEDRIPDSSTLTEMAEIMAETGFVAGVEAVEEELRARSRDARLYGALIAANLNAGSYSRVQVLYERLQYEGRTPSELMLRHVVISCFRSERTSSIQALVKHAGRKFKLNIGKELAGSLIEGYLNAQMHSDAYKVFKRARLEGVLLPASALNEMALAFLRSGDIVKSIEAIGSFEQKRGSFPSEEALAAVLSVLALDKKQPQTSYVVAIAAKRPYAGAAFQKALLQASVTSTSSAVALRVLRKISKKRTLTDFERAVEFWANSEEGAKDTAHLQSVRGTLPRELDDDTRLVMQQAVKVLCRGYSLEENASKLLIIWQLKKEYDLVFEEDFLADIADILANEGKLDTALEVIEAADVKGTRSHVNLIWNCIAHRDVSVLRVVLQRARRLPLSTNETVHAADIWMSGYNGQMERAFSLFVEAVRRHGPNGCSECQSALLQVLAERGLEKEALVQLSRMQQLRIRPSRTAYNSLVEMYLRFGEVERAGKILEHNFVPDRATRRGFVALLLSTPATSSIHAVLDELERLRLSIDTEIANEILKWCAEHGCASSARSAMTLLRRTRLTTTTYSHLIEAARKARDGALLRKTALEMPRTKSTVTALVRAFLEVGDDQGVIDAYRKSSSLLPRDQDLLHLVSQAFERAGEIDEALNIELEVQRIRLVTWARRGKRRQATTRLFVDGGPGAVDVKTAAPGPPAMALDSTLAGNNLIPNSESGEAEQTVLGLCRRSFPSDLTRCLEGIGEETWRSFGLETLDRVLERHLALSRAEKKGRSPAPGRRGGLLLSAETWGHLCAAIGHNCYADLAPKLASALIAGDVHPRMEDAQFVLGALTRQGMPAHADWFLSYCMGCYEQDSPALNILARDAIAAHLQLQDYLRAARVLTSLRSLWNAEVEDSTELLLLSAGLASGPVHGDMESRYTSLVDMVVHGRSASEARALLSKVVEGASHSGKVAIAIAAQKQMARLGLQLLPGAEGALLNAVDQSGEEYELRPVD